MANLIERLGASAKAATRDLSSVSTSTINDILEDIANLLTFQVEDIIAANQVDIKNAEAIDKDDAFIDRLTLNEERVQGIAQSVRNIKELNDPVGEIISETERPNGLLIRKVRVPIGVIGMIYESRPNVTIDAACLCLKSHNAVILRGGSEAFETNKILYDIINSALKKNDLNPDVIQFVNSTERQHVGDMLNAVDYIDVIIPRGGKGLTDKVMREAKMAVFAHLDGICHVYVDVSAKPEIARNVTVNAKMRRTGICGSAETLLLHKELPPQQKKDIINQLIKTGCTVKGDANLCAIDNRIESVTEEDWSTEYLAPIISVKNVDDVHDAINHINKYGSHHTDSILAEDPEAVDAFLNGVDSGIVLHNASTQFADGGEFGMGAEIGIATGKLHARGPVALEQLTTYKYHVLGTGQIRE